MMSRRIILLLDGTWNDADFGSFDTNIVRLRKLISSSIDTHDTPTSPRDLRPGATLAPVTMPVSSNRENIVFYERGVGTGILLNRIFGGAMGLGLDINIRRAYRFLSFHYQPGDEVFVFGFSRGSYTARSLVGYIAASGLLRRDHCTEDNERAAWDFYRTAPNERLPGAWATLTKHVHDRDRMQVACLALFDTVGSLGVPLEAFGRANREQYEFHSVDLSSITRVSLQAVAIDETRWPFQASLWRKPQFRKFTSVAEQVWFSGAHADVGGGYVEEDRRGTTAALDDITLDWMLKRIHFHFPDFPAPANLQEMPNGKDAMALQPWTTLLPHNSRTGIYLAYKRAWRSIGNLPLQNLGRWETSVGYDRQEIAINEAVHISTIARMAERRDAKVPYRPKNLAAVIPILRDAYGNGADTPLRVIGWGGDEIAPSLPSEPPEGNDPAARNAQLKFAAQKSRLNELKN